MRLQMLVLHRKERYAGEFLPEVVAVADEVTQEENPDWWPAEVARTKARYEDPDVAAWAEVSVELPLSDVMAALYPEKRAIPGVVVAPSGPEGPDQERGER